MSKTSKNSRQMAAPPTRGWTLNDVEGAQDGAGCPAYAGMDPKEAICQGREDGLPRLRGDGPEPLSPLYLLYKAAPPTRGWTRIGGGSLLRLDGCPAYAGMDPVGDLMASVLRWAAPPTRGWTLLRGRPVLPFLGCPAYAGMDPGGPVDATPRTGLPRLRGDGPRAAGSRKSRLRAAPPTRGWTLGCGDSPGS